MKNYFNIIETPDKTASKKLFDFKKALLIFVKIAKEGSLQGKNKDEIVDSVSKLMSDRRKKSSLRRNRRKKVVTRMTNKLTILENLIFKLINNNKNLHFDMIELSKPTVNMITDLLMENGNQENLRNLIENNKEKYLDQEEREKEELEEKKRLEIQERENNVKRKTHLKKNENRTNLIRNLYKSKLKPLMYLFPDISSTLLKKSISSSNIKKKGNEEKSNKKKREKSKFATLVLPNFKSKAKQNRELKVTDLVRESDIEKTFQKLEEVENEDKKDEIIAEKMTEIYRKIQTERGKTENSSHFDLISKIEETMLSSRIMNQSQNSLLKSKIEKQRESFKKKKFKFQNSAFFTKYVSKSRLPRCDRVTTELEYEKESKKKLRKGKSLKKKKRKHGCLSQRV